MKVLLIDADSVNDFPNLALMKISAAQKQLGNEIDLVKGIPESPPLEHYDSTFGSCIFFQNRDRLLQYMKGLDCSYRIGGSGYDLKSRLAIGSTSCRIIRSIRQALIWVSHRAAASGIVDSVLYLKKKA